MRQTITLLAALLIGLNANAGVFGPSTYEDCLLENMKGVTSDVAARAVAIACREKFPEKIPKKYKQFPRVNFSQRTTGHSGLFDDLISQDFENCMQECQSASYFSRTFGECRLE